MRRTGGRWDRHDPPRTPEAPLVYSLVSAPVLGFDLVRRAGGAEAADVITAALGLGVHDLAPLAAAARPDAERMDAWAELARATKDDTTVRSVASALEDG